MKRNILFFCVLMFLMISGCSLNNDLNDTLYKDDNYQEIYQNFTIRGSSMEPTLKNLEEVKVLLNPISYQRGDIVVFKFNIKDELYVKRIIAIEKDEVMFGVDGNIYVNNVLLNETYIEESSFNPENINLLLIQLESYDNVIPKGYLLVLGDNRDYSFDSTKYGLIPKDFLVGKVVLE